MAINALSLEKRGFDPIVYARTTSTTSNVVSIANPAGMAASYVRRNYAMAKAVYRAEAIRRVAGIRAARTFLARAGAEASLIDRIVALTPGSRRR